VLVIKTIRIPSGPVAKPTIGRTAGGVNGEARGLHVST
jgi:hypothetical protein